MHQILYARYPTKRVVYPITILLGSFSSSILRLEISLLDMYAIKLFIYNIYVRTRVYLHNPVYICSNAPPQASVKLMED